MTLRKTSVKKLEISSPSNFDHIINARSTFEAEKFLSSNLLILDQPEPNGNSDTMRINPMSSTPPPILKQKPILVSSMISNPTNFEHKFKARSVYEAQKQMESIHEKEKEEKFQKVLEMGFGKGLDRVGSGFSSPTLFTVEKSVAAKIYFERHFNDDLTINNAKVGREKRRKKLVEDLSKNSKFTSAEKKAFLKTFNLKESENIRKLRQKITVSCFDLLKVIGHGAFGVVQIVREKSTNEIYAMKKMKKEQMLKMNQDGHIRAERDILKEAASDTANWIVKLIYSFQDDDYLYLVMEYLAGGDLLSLLIKKDIFEEEFAKFYAAQLIMAIEEVHSMGVVHRDLKPDNILFDSEGNIKLSDFGLATSFNFTHNNAYYKDQKRVTQAAIIGVGDSYTPTSPYEELISWRDISRKKMAYSLVGTNNYIAPEVFEGFGYDKMVDWWSFGCILYEMLFGYPPFCSKTKEQTEYKILNWDTSLFFPPNNNVSNEAKDLIEKLLCHKDERLCTDERDVKSHPWFSNISFESISLKVDDNHQCPPYKPELNNESDSSNFDDLNEEDVEREMEFQVDVDLKNGSSLNEKNDSKIADMEECLEMRKKMAFAGFTYKIPNLVKVKKT